jgi:ferredoxin
MQTETGTPLQVAVDLNRCQGYAQCCFLASEVFELHGQEALWYDPAPEPAQRDRVRAAAAACPVQAIRVASSPVTSRRNGAGPHA